MAASMLLVKRGDKAPENKAWWVNGGENPWGNAQARTADKTGKETGRKNKAKSLKSGDAAATARSTAWWTISPAAETINNLPVFC